jgi:hypothetical protein
MTVWRYRFAGLLFESALHLPEWAAFGSGEAAMDPDVVIALDNAPRVPGTDEPPVVRPDEYSFFMRDAGRYRVLDGRRIVVTPVMGAGGRELRLFLLGSALGALCYQRGLLLLHASVVRLGARAIALCGSAGSGKSSLAAALIERGAAFVCDDLGRFDTASGRAIVYPSTPRLKLWREALDALPRRHDALERDHFRAEKFHLPQTLRNPWSPVPLDAIYLLEWNDGSANATVLSGVPALRSLVTSATYRPDLLEAMGQIATHWQRCAAIAAGTSVYRLARPRAWHAMGAAIDAIEADHLDGRSAIA